MMNNNESTSFVPILNVMVDYGFAPFLWINRTSERGVGGNIADGSGYYDSELMSKELWQCFAVWAIEFDRTRFNCDSGDDETWDWDAFHARGMALSRWLKEEVGDSYRVRYVKPMEDPNHHIDEETEIVSCRA